MGPISKGYSSFKKGCGSVRDYFTNKDNISHSERLGNGARGIVEGISDSLFNVLAALEEGVRWGTSSLSEKMGSKDEEVRNSRKKLKEHHKKQFKKSGGKLLGGVKKTVVGAVDGVWGIGGTAFDSLKDNYNSLRGDDKSKDEKGENNDSNKKNSNSNKGGSSGGTSK